MTVIKFSSTTSIPYLTGLEISWRPDDDSSVCSCRDVAATSPGDLAGHEGVAVKSNMFDISIQ